MLGSVPERSDGESPQCIQNAGGSVRFANLRFIGKTASGASIGMVYTTGDDFWQRFAAAAAMLRKVGEIPDGFQIPVEFLSANRARLMDCVVLVRKEVA